MPLPADEKTPTRILDRAARDLDAAGHGRLSGQVRRLAATFHGHRALAAQSAATGELGDAAAMPGVAGAAAHQPIRIQALASDMHVVVGDRVEALGRLHAHLVASLLAAGRPVTVDEIADAVWPDVSLERARRRLATAIYRLRSQLRIGESDLVIREPGGIRLAGELEGCSSDVADFLSADPADPVAAQRAVLLYEADLCARQLAYAENTFELRRWLRARYTILAVRVLRAHVERGVGSDTVSLALRVRKMAGDDAQLAQIVIEVLAQADRDAEARALAESTADVLPDSDFDDLRRLGARLAMA